MAVDTFTLMVQLPPAAREAFVTLRLVEFAVAPVTVPPQVFTKFGVAATTRLAGKASVKATPVAVDAFAFMIVNVKVEVPGATIGFGLNALLSVKGNNNVTFGDAGPSRLK
jgi:hypothetical protein